MFSMIKNILITTSLLLMSTTMLAQKKYAFKTVPNDPIKARIYTLDNGLTVYLSVNKEEPRIQTFVGVRAGGKDDPAETTGLAHYFEHMMFKGTPNFGTTNWEKEKQLIAQIEALFEVYRKTTDETKRKELYKQIDELSFEASKLAIPNEYDKLMTAIGSKGTNAFTSLDYTAYVENIPSNQLENWAKIQLDRFSAPILRLFHTELETVYEEKNMSLTNDSRRSSEAMLNALFPNHPYGTQTVLGHPEHLKNPSMTDINAFFKKYYVASNMCVTMSGDFEFDTAIAIIDKYFGKLERGNAPKFQAQPLPAMNQNQEITITGQEAENITIAYRSAPNGTEESYKADLLGMILSNGKAGLMDVNLNKKQKTLRARAGTWTMNDHGVLSLSAGKKGDQTLEEVRDLLLEQVEAVKKGQFEDWMIAAAVNNLKLQEIRRFEGNRGRANAMLMSFLNRLSWDEIINYNNKISKITKKDIVDYANQNLGNYVVIYKRKGQPDDIPIVDKPSITPIHINRDAKSDFLVTIEKTPVKPIQPKFLDFNKDITRGKLNNNIDVLYRKNTDNGLFNLVYYFPMGSDHDKTLGLAASYLRYLGTSKMSSEEIDQEFYKLACTYNISSNREETYISVSGLAENQEKAVALLETILADVQPNEAALENLIKDILKSRADSKGNQRSNFSALTNYALYGEDSPDKHIMSEAELKAVKAQDLVNVIKKMNSFKHEVLYYGTTDLKNLTTQLNKLHKTPSTFLPVPEAKKFQVQPTTQNRVLFAHYEGPQSMVQTIIKGMPYNTEIMPSVNLYNSYFGGGMNAIVFQELREKRGLAYSAWARYAAPSTPNEPFRNLSFIQTQNDKVVEALNAFNELFNDMPQSQASFTLAKESMMNGMEAERINNMDIIWSFISNRRMGRDYDLRKTLYEALPKMSMADVNAFNEQHIKDQPKTYVILGNEKLLNFDEISKQFGPVERVSAEDYFGY